MLVQPVVMSFATTGHTVATRTPYHVPTRAQCTVTYSLKLSLMSSIYGTSRSTRYDILNQGLTRERPANLRYAPRHANRLSNLAFASGRP